MFSDSIGRLFQIEFVGKKDTIFGILADVDGPMILILEGNVPRILGKNRKTIDYPFNISRNQRFEFRGVHWINTLQIVKMTDYHPHHAANERLRGDIRFAMANYQKRLSHKKDATA